MTEMASQLKDHKHDKGTGAPFRAPSERLQRLEIFESSGHGCGQLAPGGPV